MFSNSLLNNNVIDLEPSPSDSLPYRALKRLRTDHTNSGGNVDTYFIVPTSNLCEQFLSKAGYSMSDRRKSLFPRNFEMQMFLHINVVFWGICDISNVVISGKNVHESED